MRSTVQKFKTRIISLWGRTEPLLFRNIRIRRLGPAHYVTVAVIIALIVFSYGIFLFYPPVSFSTNAKIIIPDGSSLRQATRILHEEGAIRSPFVFQTIIHFKNGERGLQAGAYMFPKRLSALGIADALTTGLYQVPPTRITVFEGMRVEQIADILEHEHGIDRATFVELAKPHEGYLFPDTYFIPDVYDEEDILRLMLDTYRDRIATIRESIAQSGLSEEEVVILASIIEREARSEESMRLVAGILRKRLELGMPLQVDAVFEYLLGKTSAELTREDLAMESPYNTYTNTGLPPAPIANPGLQAIEAVLNPIPSEYLYYLTASDGVFHYAKTYEQHRRNKDLYL